MKLAFDLDSVVADFSSAFAAVLHQTSGRKLLRDGFVPRVWEWPADAGYTPKEVEKAYAFVDDSYDFWLNMRELPDMATLRLMWPSLVRNHDIYFLTSRTKGQDIKWQTEMWLTLKLGAGMEVPTPTVILTREKGHVCRALEIDAFVDDNLQNCMDVLWQSKTRVYCLDYPYNQTSNTSPWLKRIKTLGEMFDAEIENL